MKPFALSVRRRFNRTFAFGAAILVLAIGLLLAFLNENAYRAQKLREVEVQVRILADGVTAPMMFADDSTAQDFVNALDANPQVLRADVFDARGRLFVSFDRSGQSAGGAAPALASAHFNGQYVEVAQAIERDKTRYGVVFLRVQAESFLGRAARYAGIGVLIIMAALVLFVAGAAQGDLARANAELQNKATALADTNEVLAREIEHRREAEEALLQSRKMEAIGQLTGGVAHDFNNLLMVISGGLRLLEKQSGAERQEKIKEAMKQAVERGAGLTRQLLSFARGQPQTRQAIDVGRQMTGMRELLERSLRADILLDMNFPPGLPAIQVDPGELELSVLNLAVNARDAMPKGGLITLTAKRVGSHVEIIVRDTGTGIAPDVLGRIFEPYFTTKQIGQGTGLGLSQVYGFAKQSGGDVRVESEVGRGTSVILSFPASAEAAAPPPAPAASAPETKSEKRNVLVVEDDDAVAETVCAMLEELGHAATRTRSVDEALDEISRVHDYNLVFSDVVMPGGKSGIDLAQTLETVAPDLPVLLTSGYSRSEKSLRRPMLRKPYDLEALRVAIANLTRKVPAGANS